MKHALAVVVALVLLVPATLPAAQKMKIIRKGPGGETMKELTQDQILGVPELSAMILEQEKELVVDHIMEPEMRMKGYENTELKEGDRVLMADGKKLANLKELRELYEKASPGATMKLGLKRGEELVLATFKKADPRDLPQTRMIIAGGDDKRLLGIPQAGLILTEKDNAVVVERVLENAARELKGADVKEGDAITTLNTFPVRSFADFQERYEKIPVGDRVELVAKRAGRSTTLTFAKPKSEGRMIIRR